jgi:hypothetical protein
MEAQKHFPEVYEQADRLMKLSEDLRNAHDYAEADRIAEEILQVQRQIAQAMRAQQDYEEARREMDRAS